jgi:hypothetical protein
MRSRQHPSKLALGVGTLALLAMVVGACGGSAATIGDGGQQDGPGYCDQPGLFLVSPQAITLSAQAQQELKVRYACGDQTYAGVVVNYAVVGDGKGSVLSSASAQTASDGVASVTLTAGTQSATFQVTASTPDTAPVTFSITVNTDNVGTISVTMTYGGAIVYTEYTAYLFDGVACTAVDPFSPAGAVQVAAPVGVISAKPQFVSVPAGTNHSYTVAVVAKKATEILGFGCTPAITVTAGAKTDTTVAIEDIPITFSGTYVLDNHFDFADLLPPSVENIVDIFDEMTDDDDVNGNATTQDFGIDPAAFLLDFVYRQICHWQCNSGETFDTCSQINHGWGDQKLIYTEDFKTWSGNKPRFTGACGILDESWGANQYVQTQVQNLIVSYVPDVILRVLTMIGDLARAINKAHIKSHLILSDIRPGRQGNFSHELKTMMVDLHDLAGTLHSYEVDLASAGVGTISYTGNTTVLNDKLQIPSHTFQLKFGKLVQYIYLNYLLPMLGYTSTADMFKDWVNCASVGTWLDAKLNEFIGISPGATTLAGYCTTGLEAGGAWVENSMANWISAETQFTLTGECSADQIDAHRVATSLKDGTWDGHWSEGGAQADFTGTFTGIRQ